MFGGILFSVATVCWLTTAIVIAVNKFRKSELVPLLFIFNGFMWLGTAIMRLSR